MNKIADIEDAIRLATEARKRKEKIVLVGGCFDILHIGHIKFLEKAKESGEKLYILLESDKNVRKLKGFRRPIFNQQDRAEALSSLKDVDLIINLPYLTMDREYEKLIEEIKPDIIAVTENDPILSKKNRQAEKTGARLKIIPFVKSLSSSKLAEILGRENI